MMIVNVYLIELIIPTNDDLSAVYAEVMLRKIDHHDADIWDTRSAMPSIPAFQQAKIWVEFYEYVEEDGDAS